MARDRGQLRRDGRGNVRPGSGRGAYRPKLSLTATVFGVLGLAAVVVLVNWGVLGYAGFGIEAVAGVEIGTFVGLLCLAVEIAVLKRAFRLQVGDPAQSTFGTFFLRLAVVAPFTMWFMQAGVGVHAAAFALSFCGTFFVYLCWLTWRIGSMPSQYEMNKRAGQAREPVTVRGARR